MIEADKQHDPKTKPTDIERLQKLRIQSFQLIPDEYSKSNDESFNFNLPAQAILQI